MQQQSLILSAIDLITFWSGIGPTNIGDYTRTTKTSYYRKTSIIQTFDHLNTRLSKHFASTLHIHMYMYAYVN